MIMSSILVVASSVFIPYRLGVKVPKIEWPYLKEPVWFSAGIYLAALLQGLPAPAITLI
jgi:hypothetical protein